MKPSPATLRCVAILAGSALVGCSSSGTSSPTSIVPLVAAVATVATVATAPPVEVVPTVPLTVATVAPVTAAPTTVLELVAPPTNLPELTVPPTDPPQLTATPTVAPILSVAAQSVGGVHHAVPVSPASKASFGKGHHDYPATDIFAGCGATVVSPVDGMIADLRRTDPWVASVDDPFTRGGEYVSIIGDDGVRYYLAHFRKIGDAVDIGVRVAAGDPLGEQGKTGRAGGCHTHLGLSPACPNDEWWVRRGVVWPYEYLKDWKSGGNSSPAAEVAAWLAANPTTCAGPPPAK